MKDLSFYTFVREALTTSHTFKLHASIASQELGVLPSRASYTLTIAALKSSIESDARDMLHH